MAARVLADVVVALHLVFLAYMVLGGFLALRRFGLVWPHVAVIVYSFYVTLTSFTCPATTLEKWLRETGGETPYEGSFIAQYLRGTLYPASWETAIWIGCMAVGIASWACAVVRRRRRGAGDENRTRTVSLGS
ncbi:UNVERIFIED_ORG: DUF2784 domain-containing protein [Bacillus sp. AZ43]